ncbi:MAG: hypothetical protein CBC48_12025 [bacterium TMED88]|nr:MAG: hypothetical protein CBC48_12025 [bacterium TMED88]
MKPFAVYQTQQRSRGGLASRFNDLNRLPMTFDTSLEKDFVPIDPVSDHKLKRLWIDTIDRSL